MFVIMRCFNNIPVEERRRNGMAKNMGITMQHAGVSITVTTLTDVLAFGIGAITTFPSLNSFCTCSAIAIGTIYIFQSSWFIAWMILDQRRIDEKRDGLIPCIVHEKWESPAWSQVDHGSLVMSKLAKAFEFKAFQAVIIIITLGMFGAGVWGTYSIKVEYDPIHLVPKASYLKEWLDKNDVDFPNDGWGVSFYTERVPYTVAEFEKIDQVVHELNETVYNEGYVHYGKDLPKSVSTGWEQATGFWWTDFKEYLAKHKDVTDWREVINAGLMPMYLSDFLFHEDGSINTYDFRFDGELTCNLPAPGITSLKLGSLKFKILTGPKENGPARAKIEDIFKRANLSSGAVATSPIYPGWEIEDILANELVRNLSLALLCVIVVVFVTLADVRICFLVLSCVLFTMIDVTGVTYIWGMTLDPFVFLSIIVGIGLSVDYSAHISHSFIISKGTKRERTINGFISIRDGIHQIVFFLDFFTCVNCFL
jgi:Niemann-Pick C1 protein